MPEGLSAGYTQRADPTVDRAAVADLVAASWRHALVEEPVVLGREDDVFVAVNDPAAHGDELRVDEAALPFGGESVDQPAQVAVAEAGHDVGPIAFVDGARWGHRRLPAFDAVEFMHELFRGGEHVTQQHRGVPCVDLAARLAEVPDQHSRVTGAHACGDGSAVHAQQFSHGVSADDARRGDERHVTAGSFRSLRRSVCEAHLRRRQGAR